MTENQTDPLEALDPSEQVIVINDTTIRVRPLKARQLAPFTRALRPIMPTLGGMIGGIFGRVGDAPTTEEALRAASELDLDGADLLELLEHADDLIDAVAIGASLDPEWLGEQTPEVLLRLLGPVVAVNLDFFIRELVPAAVAALELATATATTATNGTGSSPDSPAPVSLAATSSR